MQPRILDSTYLNGEAHAAPAFQSAGFMIGPASAEPSPVCTPGAVSISKL